MLRMHAEILFCRKKRESERKTQEGKGTDEGMHTRGNSEYGNERQERLKLSDRVRAKKRKRNREKRRKEKKECERGGRDEEGN